MSAAVSAPNTSTRDYWRSAIINGVARELGHSIASFETVLIQNKSQLGGSMLTFLDELCDQEAREGRTHGMQLGCRRRCTEIAKAYRHLASASAPRAITDAPAQPQFDEV